MALTWSVVSRRLAQIDDETSALDERYARCAELLRELEAALIDARTIAAWCDAGIAQLEDHANPGPADPEARAHRRAPSGEA